MRLWILGLDCFNRSVKQDRERLLLTHEEHLQGESHTKASTYHSLVKRMGCSRSSNKLVNSATTESIVCWERLSQDAQLASSGELADSLWNKTKQQPQTYNAAFDDQIKEKVLRGQRVGVHQLQ